MIRRHHALAAFTACALSFGASSAFAGVSYYDFSADEAAYVATPATIGLATFSSPSDPGAYTFSPNAGLYTDLGAFVLSSAGSPATLDITFSVPQDTITFDFSVGDWFASGGSDTLTLTTDTGATTTATATPVGSDFFPEGTVTLAVNKANPFTTVALSSAYPITIADLTSVPEPASLMLFSIGLAGLGVVARRRRA